MPDSFYRVLEPSGYEKVFFEYLLNRDVLYWPGGFFETEIPWIAVVDSLAKVVPYQPTKAELEDFELRKQQRCRLETKYALSEEEKADLLNG